MKRLLILIALCLCLGCEQDKSDVGRLEKFIEVYKPRVIVIGRGPLAKDYLDMCIKKGYKVDCVSDKDKTITMVRDV